MSNEPFFWSAEKRKDVFSGINIPATMLVKVSSGVQASFDVVHFLAKIAKERGRHPAVRNLALNIVKDIPDFKFLDEARAIGQWVQKNIRYVRDIAGAETIHDPVTLIDQYSRNGIAQADCDDMALLVASLLISIGVRPYYKIVKYSPYGGFQHIYTVVKERNKGEPDAKELVIDAIVKDKPIGFEVRHLASQLIPIL
jgi:hypothetical protein